MRYPKGPCSQIVCTWGLRHYSAQNGGVDLALVSVLERMLLGFRV